MASNIFWNLVFLVDLGGVIGLVLVAFERWPGLAARLELVLYAASCLIILVLAGVFILARVFGPKRGVWIHGVHYTDVWRDD